MLVNDQIQTTTRAMCSSIAKKAMKEVWGRSPNRIQCEITPTILQVLRNDLSPEAQILAQQTGSGKSSVL